MKKLLLMTFAAWVLCASVTAHEGHKQILVTGKVLDMASVHVLINHLPIFGLAIVVLALGLGLLARNRPSQRIALVLIALIGYSTWFVIQSGHRGYDPVYTMSNPDAQGWLKVHADRVERVEFVFYLAALIAAAAALADRRFPKASRPLTWLALLAALASASAAGWISQAGGQVRHSEFRDGPPPVRWLPKEGHREILK